MRVPDYYVRLVELPPTVLGATLPNDDGTFSVYINARLGDAARRETLCHELEHMARDHFYQSAPIAAQEAEARRRSTARCAATAISRRSRRISKVSARSETARNPSARSRCDKNWEPAKTSLAPDF